MSLPPLSDMQKLWFPGGRGAGKLEKVGPLPLDQTPVYPLKPGTGKIYKNQL